MMGLDRMHASPALERSHIFAKDVMHSLHGVLKSTTYVIDTVMMSVRSHCLPCRGVHAAAAVISINCLCEREAGGVR